MGGCCCVHVQMMLHLAVMQSITEPTPCMPAAEASHLNEVHSGIATGLHQQHSYVVLGLLNAAAQHAQKDRRVVIEVHRELLCFLHMLPKRCWLNSVSVVKEEVTFACQLYLQMQMQKPGQKIYTCYTYALIY